MGAFIKGERQKKNKHEWGKAVEKGGGRRCLLYVFSIVWHNLTRQPLLFYAYTNSRFHKKKSNFSR